MNASQSPHVTGDPAIRNGRSSTSWRGPSLSKAKPSPSCPISTMPPSWSIQPGSGRPASGRTTAARRTAERSGLRDRAWWMSMTSSSWCCCSWCRPSSSSSAVRVGRTAVEQLQHGGVDVLAVLGDLRDAWAGDQPALGSGVTSADGLVVGVEQEAEALVVRACARVRARTSRRTTSCGRGATWSGLASGIDCTVWSSALSGAASRSVSDRTAQNSPFMPSILPQTGAASSGRDSSEDGVRSAGARFHRTDFPARPGRRQGLKPFSGTVVGTKRATGVKEVAARAGSPSGRSPTCSTAPRSWPSRHAGVCSKRSPSSGSCATSRAGSCAPGRAGRSPT